MHTIETQFTTTLRQLIREVMPTVLRAVAAESRSPVLKADGSYVTETDLFVERHLIERLRTLFPTVPVLGEEMATEGRDLGTVDAPEFYASFLTSPFHIIIDPIDGTKNFVEGGKPFCIAAALTRAVGDGIWPVASVVVLPMEGVMFWTDDQQVRREVLSSGAIEEVERRSSSCRRISVNSSDRAWLTQNGFKMKLPWISSGSSVHDFMGTATGELCGSMVGKQRLWDLMAPLAIAERLGCVLRDLSTGDVLSRVTPSELSSDLSSRAWGIDRKMVLAPLGTEVASLIAPV